MNENFVLWDELVVCKWNHLINSVIIMKSSFAHYKQYISLNEANVYLGISPRETLAKYRTVIQIQNSG